MSSPGKAILIIDDEPDIGEALSLGLQMEGYAASFAQDREHALVLMQQQPPDAILLDYRMPGLDTAEFVALARQQQARVLIVLMSGTEEPALQAARLGLDLAIQKPFEIDKVVELIRRHAT